MILKNISKMEFYLSLLFGSKLTKYFYIKFSIINLIMCISGFNISAQHHQNHEGLQHWEIPSKNPDRIILTFFGNPASSRAVTWRTDSTIKNGFAQIAEALVNGECPLSGKLAFLSKARDLCEAY